MFVSKFVALFKIGKNSSYQFLTTGGLIFLASHLRIVQSFITCFWALVRCLNVFGVVTALQMFSYSPLQARITLDDHDGGGIGSPTN